MPSTARVIAFIISEAVLITTIIVLGFFIAGANGYIVSDLDLSTCFTNGTCTDYHHRYEIVTPLVSGIVETLTLVNFTGSTYDIDISLENVNTYCDFFYYDTICDCDIETEQELSCWDPTECTISEDDCNRLCEPIYFRSSACFFGVDFRGCMKATLKPIFCYEVRLLDPASCLTHGTLKLVSQGITSNFDITKTYDPKTSNDITVIIQNTPQNLPFPDTLTTLHSTDDNIYKVLDEDELCVFNNAIGCRGPVRIDEGEYIVKADTSTRIKEIHSSVVDVFDIVYDIELINRQIGHSFERANPLEVYTSDYSINKTTSEIYFPQLELTDFTFMIDVFAKLDSETFPVCDVVSSEIECTGESTQQFMLCIFKLVISGTEGTSVKLRWNEEDLLIPCRSDTITLPQIERTEEQFNYCIEITGKPNVCSKADVDIKHEKPSDGDEDGTGHQDGKGKSILPDEPFNIPKINKEVFNWLIILLVVACVLVLLMIIICFWPEWRTLFNPEMNRINDVKMKMKFLN